MEAGAVGLTDRVYGQKVAAFVSLREGFLPTEQELRDFARQRLSDYKVPECLWFLAVLPKGLTGKVDRRALAEIAASRTEAVPHSREAKA
jgi:acyl-coenzyme A synthetase/AMP-(fatty) acid ligase